MDVHVKFVVYIFWVLQTDQRYLCFYYLIFQTADLSGNVIATP